MTLRSRMIVPAIITLTFITAAQAYAQLSDDPSPTVVSPQYSSGASPYLPSTTPPGDVPEGVTTYFWPEITSLPKAETASLPRVTTAMYAPQQTTLAPMPVTTVGYAAPGGQCVCTPVGQVAQPAHPYYAQPQANYAPAVGPGQAFAYRPVLPVSQLPPDYYFGRGLIGQPKVYVTGQPVRNALRFVTP